MGLKDKSLIGLATLAIAGWFCFWLKTKQVQEVQVVEKVVMQTIEVEKVVEVQKTRWQTKTVVRPDGTTEVTETRSESHSSETSSRKEALKEQSRQMSPVPKPSYSLGLSVSPVLKDLSAPPNYQLEVGARLATTPAWVTLGISTDKKVWLGLRLEI